MAPPKEGGDLQGDTALDERKRVLFHASSLNRSDIISKVVIVASTAAAAAAGAAPSSSTSKGGEIDREVLDHVDEGGLTALHHAVKKSSLDAIRVLLRLGVDVTPKGGESSPFAGLTAYQVALSGRCKGNPEDIKQIFLTEAVQAIAAGDAERLGEFLEAGVDASSKYGVEGGNAGGGNSMSLADWAEQLGQGDMLSALFVPPGSSSSNDGTTLPGNDASGEAGRAEEGGEGGGEEELTAGGGVARWGGGETPDDVGLFVEGLREAIVDLTAESEELEEELSRRGTLGIIKRARATRQDLILAHSEVETANALCDRWRAEEEAAAEENALLQAQVVKAQSAVERHRAGLDINDNNNHQDDRSHPSAGGEEEGNARDRPDQQQKDQESQSINSGSKRRPADRTRSSSSRPSTPPPPPPPLEGTRAARIEDVAGEDNESGSGDGGMEKSAEDAEGGSVESTRRREEAEALSSQLQIIAMHLEDELRMMRSLIGSEGAVGVVRRIRALREEIEAAEEEARQTYAVSRYLQARVIVLNDDGDELFSQLDRLKEYLRRPAGEALRPHDDSELPRAANKEDIDEDEYYHHHGGGVRNQTGQHSEYEGEEDGEIERGGARAPAEYNTGGRQYADENDGGEDVNDDDAGEHRYHLRAPPDGEDAQPPPTVAAPASSAPAMPPLGSDQDNSRGDANESSDGMGVGVIPPPQPPPRPSERQAASASDTSARAGDTAVPGEDSTAVAATDESDSGRRRGAGSDREGRARTLLSAPGGSRGAARGGTRKVTIAQDVMSVLFGWDVSSAAEKKEARGELMKADCEGNSRGGGSAGVMFA